MTEVGRPEQNGNCPCGADAWDVTATLIACRVCGRLWGRVNGAWVLDPDTEPLFERQLRDPEFRRGVEEIDRELDEEARRGS